jgi:hypothetical protein
MPACWRRLPPAKAESAAARRGSTPAEPNGLDKALSRIAGCWHMGIRIIRRLLRPVPVVYVTRFNLAIALGKQPQQPVHLDLAWLEERLALFERYCVPKMAAQTDDRFRWLILISPETNAAIVKRLARAPNAELVPVAPGTALGSVVAARVAQMGESIITARLDSDDQLSVGYTKALRAIEWSGRRRFAAYFTKGLYLNAATGAYRVARLPLNQFPAVFERRQSGDFLTVHAHRHNELFKSMDAIQIWTKRPMWCTIVHGGNASNRMTGKPVHAPLTNW